MITTEQAGSIRQRCDALQAFLGKRRSYKPDEVAHLNPPSNDEISSLELFELHRDQPEAFTAYVPWGEAQTKHFGTQSIDAPSKSRDVTTWTGQRVATVASYGPWHRNNFGGKWRQVTIKPDFCRWYYAGREYDSRQCVNFRRLKSAF